MVKYVKKPIVKIFPDGRVIGTDETFSSLNMVLDFSVMGSDIFPCPFIFDSREITAFMREINKDYDFYNPLFEFPYKFRTTNRKDILELYNHVEMNYRIDELYNRVISQELTKPILYRDENIQSSVPEMFSLKSSDGAKMFNINKHFLMTSFNAIHPASKSDKVNLVIRDSDMYSYTAEFMIYKKKENYTLHEILRFRKL
jgi:hypothetical protein